MLTPEERRIPKGPADAKYHARNSLSLPLRQNPVLDPYAFPGDRVRIPRDVARCVDIRSAGSQILVHNDAVIDREAGRLGQLRSWQYA